MPLDITGLGTSIGTGLGGAARVVPTTGEGFASSLGKLIEGVEQTSSDANTAVVDMLDKKGDVHEAMLALVKAEVSLQLTVQVRNKLVQAYQDVMRMPI